MTVRRVDAGGCSDSLVASRSQGACLVTSSELPSAFCFVFSFTCTSIVVEAASVKLLGMGSGGTWSSSCLAAGPRRLNSLIEPATYQLWMLRQVIEFQFCTGILESL